ncbi:hypothetical protein [Flavobacterium aestivum]|uniref:hypothetical protein n=1 Tax=Flavobacterium aestivum TaxID=3003257 RepID=UPI002482DBCB|nr:hypothetical protein [Flavobacterium aestivum]
MDIFLHKSKLFFCVFFLLVISGSTNAQCTITGSSVVNASTLTCGTSPLSSCNGILYIGDGVTPTSLYMNAALNLTCLGAIQLIVRNGGTLDFSAGNDYLTLAEGSSVTFESGGALVGGSCNASERLYIGTNLLASCNGGAGADLNFADLVSFGGTGRASSNSPVCVGNNIVLSATPPPNGTFTYKWTGPNSFSSTLQNPTPFSATTTPNVAGIYTVSIKRTSDGKTIDAYTTVVVNSGTLPSAPTVSQSQPTCSVATGTISVLTPTPDGTLKYSINGLTYTNTSGAFTSVSPGTYSVTAKNASGCISPALSVTVNNQPATPVAPTLSSNSPICSGSNAVFTIHGTAGNTVTYTGAASSTATIGAGGTVDVTITGVTANTTLNLTNVSNGTCSLTLTGVTSTVTVNPNLAASVNIAASPSGTICSGTSVTFTATPTNGGATPAYQWKLNGGNVGTNSATYTNSALANGDSVTCVMTSNAACATGSPATSNTVSMVVNPSLVASVSIAASPSGAICSGTSVTFTATPTNGGATPAYQWKLNGGNVGTNSATYTNSALANGDSVTCIMTSNATPCLTGSPATSNVVTMTVNPMATLAGVSQDNAACAGSGAIINLTGLVPSSTSTLNYTINGVSQTDVTGVVANASGVASFTTPLLTTANNGQTLQVTGVTITSAIPNCGASFLKNVTLNVNPDSVGGSISGSQTLICVNTTTGTLTLGGGYVGAIVQWEKRLDSGSWVTIPNTAATYSESPSVAGVWEYRALVQSGACPAVYSSSFTVTVESGMPTAPVLTDIVLGCNQTVVTGTWAAVSNAANYKFDVSLDPSFGTFLSGYQDISVAPTASPSVVVSGLTPGVTYYIRARTVNSCGTASINSNVATVSVIITRTSNGYSWDNGVPDSSKKAVFIGSGNLSSCLNACSCQINSGVAVQVDSGIVMTLENGLAVVGTGTLTFENNASLVQVNDAAFNSGTIIYKRNTTPMKNYDFTYWSSPVAGQTLKALSPNTLADKYFSFSMNNWVIELNGLSTMSAGKGYIIRVPKPDILYPNGEYWTGATYVQPVQFKGAPNNGVYSLPIDPVGYGNLIGNPYPCAISADAFLLENSINNSRIDGTIYFWTHNTAVSNNRYSGTDYASYNYLGGVGTSAAPSGSTGGANNSVFSGYIAAGQSFLAISAGAGPVIFNNSMRVNLTNKNTQFFKGTKSKAVPIEKHRVWLNLANTEGAFKQVLVGYVTGATNGFDPAFDGLSLDSNKYIDFYSVNDNKNFVIQGRSLPFDKTDKVPLGYKTNIEGTFVISIDRVDGILANESVFVEDKVKGVVVDLKKGPYSFTTTIGTFNDRFVLRFTANDSVTNVLKTVDSDKSVIVSVKNHQIQINSFDKIIDKLMIYDLNGRLLYEIEKVDSNVFSVPNFNSSEQFLIVQTLLKNGEWSTKEIVF